MSKILQIQTNFTSGELSPRLYAHVDISKYKNGLKQATNAVIVPHGPVRRRNGFKYIATTKTISKASRLLKFQFDQTNAYILEFGENYIRFYRNGGQILSSGLPYEVTTTYLASELFNITYQQFGRLLYLFHANHAPAILTWTSDTNWSLADITFRPKATTENGDKPNMTCTPAATSGTGINFTVGSAYFLASDVGRQIRNLSGLGRASITSISSTTVAVCTIVENFPSTSAIASGNWIVDLSPVVSLTPSGSVEGSIITLTAAANAWRATDVGRYVIINNGAVNITSYTSATVVSGVIEKSLNAVTASTNWSLENAVWDSTDGYPQICTLYQSRLFAGSNSTYPQRVWATESGILDSLGAGSEDSAALDFDLSGKEISKISWMAGIRGQLAIGTTSTELTLDSGSTGPLTPSTLIQQPRGYHGSNLQQPVSLDDEIIYIQRSGKKINAFHYMFQVDNYVSEDLLFLAEHLPGTSAIKELAYAQDPDRILYAVTNDGNLLACTYVKEQQVIGWAKWNTDGLFESINTISTGDHDEVWAVVNRTINGTTQRYIERLDVSDGTNNTDGFSDCYLTYSSPITVSGITNANPGVITATSHGLSNGNNIKLIGIGGMTQVIGKTYTVANVTTNTFTLKNSAGADIDTTLFTTYTSGGYVYKLVTTISGLSYLEGKTVQIKADGATHDDKTVHSGSITLDRASYELTIGLKYDTIIATLPQEYNLGIGSQQGQQTRAVRPILRFYNSTNPKLDGEYVPARNPGDLMDDKLGLFTGDLVFGSFTWKDGFSSSQVIETNNPFPMMLLGIMGSRDGGNQ